MTERQFGTDVMVLTDRNATVVSIELIEADTMETVATVTGSSMRAPGDKHDEQIAVSLAMGRAFEKLGRKLVRRGDGMVKAADNVAAAKKARKEKSNEAVSLETGKALEGAVSTDGINWVRALLRGN